MTKHDRPTGVTIVALLNILNSWLMIFLGLAVTILSAVSPSLFNILIGVFQSTNPVLFYFVLMVVTVSSILGMVCSIGMFAGWKWVWYTSIVVWSLDLICVFIGGFSSFLCIIYIFFIAYWFTKGPREWFGIKF